MAGVLADLERRLRRLQGEPSSPVTSDTVSSPTGSEAVEAARAAGMTFGEGRPSPAAADLRRLLRPILGEWPYGLPTDLEARFWITVRAEVVAPDLPAVAISSSLHRVRRGTRLSGFLLTVLPPDCSGLVLRVVTAAGPQGVTIYQRLLTATAVQYLVLPRDFTDEDFNNLAAEVRCRFHHRLDAQRSRSRSPASC